MDSSKKYENPSPEENANVLSRLFFCWVLPFFKYGYKNDLQVKDIFNATKEDNSGPLGDNLEMNWLKEVQKCKGTKKRPSFSRAIYKTFWKSYAIYGTYLLLSTALRMIQPIVLAAYIKYYDTPTETKDAGIGWSLGSGVILLAFLNVILNHNANIGNQRVGMRARIATCSLIYRKLLKLNHVSLGNTDSGQLVNLLSNDVQRFDMASIHLHYIWLMPIAACFSTYVMYRSVGLAAIPGLLAITIQAIPVQGYLSRLQGVLRYKVAKKTDSRVKLMNEITSGIQVIKMYAWEKPFEKMVALARKHEIDIVARTSYIRGFTMALMVYTERTTLYLTLITYVLMNNKLTGDVVFAMAQLFNTLQLYMCIFYPMAMSGLAEAKVSIRRVEDFLLQDENLSISEKIVPVDKKGAIKLIKASASWIPNPIVDTLINLDFELKPGTLCCVVGNVGAGKSSLLQLLLNELPLSTGKMEVNGTLSYASQQPWLFVSSVRNNILFGQPYVKNRYKEVVRVCALETDFDQFPHQDKTLVGERGVSLSGGQRARINLARAVYREADVYLFDDPLSAVDTHVGKHLFEQCIKKHLQNKTRILVTHQLQFIKQADLIIVLNNGKIEKITSAKDLSENNLQELALDKNAPTKDENVLKRQLSVEKPSENRERLKSISSVNSSVLNEDEEGEKSELMGKGAISSSVYKEYCYAGASIFSLLFLFFLLALAQAANNAGDLWLTHWTNMIELKSTKSNQSLTQNSRLDDNSTSLVIENLTLENNGTNLVTQNSTSDTDTSTILTTLDPILAMFSENTTNTTKNLNTTTPFVGNMDSEFWSTNTYIYIYTFFIIAAIILTNARSWLFFKLCMNSSKNLHNTMFNNVLKAPMRFFDTNPSGRILTRFSKDMGIVDELLPRATLDAIQIFSVMIGILAMVFIKLPWMIIPAIFLGVLFYYFRVVYLSTAQDVMRLEGVTKAPVFSHVSASLYGLSTIRSSKAQELIIREFDILQDQHSGTWTMFLNNSVTFGMYLDFISTLFLSLVTFQFLVTDDGSTLSANVGLVISQSMILTGMLQFGVRQTAEVASNMTSVERVLQYTKLDKEGPFESLPAKKPPRNWLSHGGIVFRNTYLQYAPENPPVLKNLSVEIKPGEKVGIVGRTGAGKSTLIASLFRLAKIEGTIAIDNVNTQYIGLSDLRKNISIIPQEPVLFSASVRYNLDPFDKVDDATLWKALEDVELKDVVEDLSQRVSEGGANFSAGQRQLMCLARAIVRNNKVLVMDEATANVDPETDNLIQTTIRRNFKECTVLTIAHRLNTIMDSDKVLVMDAGQAVEFNHPHVLLKNPDGHFSKMVQQTGTEMEKKLRKIAEDDYNSKNLDEESKLNESTLNEENFQKNNPNDKALENEERKPSDYQVPDVEIKVPSIEQNVCDNKQNDSDIEQIDGDIEQNDGDNEQNLPDNEQSISNNDNDNNDNQTDA